MDFNSGANAEEVARRLQSLKWQAESSQSRLSNFQLLADCADCAFLDFSVARHAGDLTGGRVYPDCMPASFTVEGAALPSQMPLQLNQFHASAS